MTTSTVPKTKVLTLCLVVEEGCVLLGMKKRGFGEGRWNGFGGKVEAGETIADAARRELREEAGIDAALEEIGTLTFAFEGDPVALEVHVFRGSDRVGEPQESEEMRPRWFAFDAVPYGEMWPDDRYWLPHALAGQRFRGHFRFEGHDRIIGHELEIFEGQRIAA